MTADIPKSPDEVLAVIQESERHRKFAWTASRVLKQGFPGARLDSLPSAERKAALRRVTDLLEDLTARRILRRRSEFQSIGYGDEIGFDYLALSGN